MSGREGRVAPAGDGGRTPALTATPTDTALLSAWASTTGESADLGELLGTLDRRARPLRPALTRAAAAFGWDRADERTRAWVPQGISTSSDAHSEGTVRGRAVVAVSWYLRTADGADQGARVSFVDITEPAEPRYRHVLLAEPVREPATGTPSTGPVAVHAGGIVWYGDRLYVAATYSGLRVFDLADLLRVDPATHGGCDFLLPQRSAYRPPADDTARMRYSFVSLDRTSSPHALLAGEYVRRTAPARIVRFPLDAATGDLHGEVGTAQPSESFALGMRRMQGVACVRGRYHVTASNSRWLRGDLWVGDPHHGFGRRRWALPPGPEALCAWPARGQLWSLTEWAGRRTVFALRTADW
jgi:hypothetical protein